MKWSPPVDRLLGGLATIAMFAIGHRGPTGDDWTWEAPKGAPRSPLGGGPILPLAAAVAVGMMFGMAALASFENDGGLSQLAVLQPTPTEAPDAAPTVRPAGPVVRAPTSTPVPSDTAAPTPPPGPSAVLEPEPAPAAAPRAPRSNPAPTPGPTPAPPLETARSSPTPAPTPVPAPTPAPVASEGGKVTGGGRAGDGQFSVEALHTGDGELHGGFNYHNRDLRIESETITAIALASGPCGPATRAVVTGIGTVNGDTGVAFQVTADDCGEPGGPSPGGLDYISIVAGGGSAEGHVSGNLQVQLDD